MPQHTMHDLKIRAIRINTLRMALIFSVKVDLHFFLVREL